ncbi:MULTISPECIES: competence type IV pilus minor pilin ComGD [Ureibacillus]|uniref:Type II secretory pathway pseudopilin PulG n=1 Tax=Ureibacillus thermosphaericus TaxID=51173 RepID=A0A840Q165_URETH|nr:competence type IV pilus minor pilin ComGD [Ureibacillus thermosphaericus]MBB5148806.1 type II secretory pathway pseudopilin PulG [Ureibacillus thermosphaericus]NKZ31584.1 type II secretion system protein [Ureibacillus thermosphaericus]
MKEQGYTLLEILFVLMIVVLVGMLGTTFSFKMTEKMVVEQFFHQFTLDIQMAQMLALEKQRSCFVSFVNQDTYRIYHQLDEVILERKLPEIIEFDQYSNLLTLRIDPDGNVKNFGKFTFYTPFGQKHIVININKGRIRYVE